MWKSNDYLLPLFGVRFENQFTKSFKKLNLNEEVSAFLFLSSLISIALCVLLIEILTWFIKYKVK